MHIPYVGITDFMTFKQVKRMLTVFEKHLESTQRRRLHVGVMMSYKTLNGIETKWANVFPQKETIASIFKSNGTMNCLQYADYGGVNICENISDRITESTEVNNLKTRPTSGGFYFSL